MENHFRKTKAKAKEAMAFGTKTEAEEEMQMWKNICDRKQAEHAVRVAVLKMVHIVDLDGLALERDVHETGTYAFMEFLQSDLFLTAEQAAMIVIRGMYPKLKLDGATDKFSREVYNSIRNVLKEFGVVNVAPLVKAAAKEFALQAEAGMDVDLGGAEVEAEELEMEADPVVVMAQELEE